MNEKLHKKNLSVFGRMNLTMPQKMDWYHAAIKKCFERSTDQRFRDELINKFKEKFPEWKEGEK